MAGDTLITMALADSLFFSIRPGAARGKVILYLLLTMAPFAVVGPLLGPVLDKSRTGRRTVVILSAASRALVCLSMAYPPERLAAVSRGVRRARALEDLPHHQERAGPVRRRARGRAGRRQLAAGGARGRVGLRDRRAGRRPAEGSVPRRRLGAAARGAGVRLRDGCGVPPASRRRRHAATGRRRARPAAHRRHPPRRVGDGRPAGHRRLPDVPRHVRLSPERRGARVLVRRGARRPASRARSSATSSRPASGGSSRRSAC